MAVAVKGLLKGLRYISNIFEEEDDEPEMQIGGPTDVKHVAHIGWDGPTASPPSWMNQYRGDDEPGAPSIANVAPESPTRRRSKGSRHSSGGSPESPKRRSSSSNHGGESQSKSVKLGRKKKSKSSSSVGSSSSKTSAKQKGNKIGIAETDPSLR